MSKFFKRQGTSAYKFQIDLFLRKLEFNVPFPCRLSVIFKHGNNKRETNSAASIENGEAIFNEILILPATFYFDQKKKTFIEKEVTLVVQTITQRGTKIAGVTKIDLSEFVNLNISEKECILPVGKCFDKNAKFYFNIHLRLLQELTQVKPADDVLKFSSRNLKQETIFTSIDNLESEHPRIGSPVRHELPLFIPSPHMFSPNTLKIPIPQQSEQQALSEAEETLTYKSKFKLNNHDAHNRSHTSDSSRIHNTLIKTRDTSPIQSTIMPGLGKAPVKSNLNDSSTSCNNLEALQKKILHLEEQLFLEMEEKHELHTKYEKKEEQYQNMMKESYEIQKSFLEMKKLNESAQENPTKLQDELKKSEAELKLAKVNILSLTENNEKLKEDLIACQNSNQELQKLNESLLMKLQVFDQTVQAKIPSHASIPENKGLDGIQNTNTNSILLTKITELETANTSLNELVNQTKLENDKLKKKIIEYMPDHKSLEKNPKDKEIQANTDLIQVPNIILKCNASIQTDTDKTLYKPIIDNKNQDKHTHHDSYFDSSDSILPDNDKLVQECNELKEELDFYSKKVEEFHEEIEQLKLKLDQKEKLIDDLNKTISTYKNLNETLQSTLTITIEKEREKEREKAVKILDEYKQIFTKNEQEITSKYDTCKLELNNMAAKFEETDKENIRLNVLIVEKNNTINELQTLVEKFKNAQKILSNEDKILNQRLNLQLKQTEKEKQELEFQYKDKIIALNNDMNSIKQENEFLIMNLQKTKEDNDKLKKEIEILKNTHAKYELNSSQNETLEAQNKKLLMKLNKAQEDIKLLHDAINQSEKDKKFLRSVIDLHEEKIKTTKEELEKIEKDAWKAKNTLGKMLNSAFEFGGAEFLETIEQYLNEEESNIL